MNPNLVVFETSFGVAAQLPESDLPEIVFSGRSNVGKSSLINKVLNRKNLARVSGTPGKTTTINFFKGEGFRLVDLPGYGYAKRSESEKQRWAGLMEAYFAKERRFGMIVQLVDMRHPPTADDRGMIEFLQARGYPFVVALTKSDKLSKREREARLLALGEEIGGGVTLIETSAQTGEGIDRLHAIIDAVSLPEQKQ